MTPPNLSAGVGWSNGTSYTTSSNGWVYIASSAGNSTTTLTIGDVTLCSFNRGGEWWGNNSSIIPVKKGVVCTGRGASVLTFYPCY